MLQSHNQFPVTFYLFLALSFLGAWFFPIESVSGTPGAIAALTAYTTPIFAAGIIFAISFERSAEPARVLGSNMLGSMAGGLLEAISFVTGLRALLIVCVVLYGLSWVCLGRQNGRGS